MRWTIGSVPYVNAVPLVHGFEGPDSPIEVVYDVPSQLPERLATGECAAILVSSVDAFRNPGRRIADGVCIGSWGPVESVRMFSRVPFGQIRKLALDQSSMTSNLLAQVLLAELHGVRPYTEARPPVLEAMLQEFDAAILIGDIGMSADGADLHVMDLGEAWTGLTGLPFVWATWQGGAELVPDLADRLAARVPQGFLLRTGFEGAAEHAVFEAAQRRSGWDRETVVRYLTQTMHFGFGPEMRQGLLEFQQRLLSNGFVRFDQMPVFVSGEATASV